MAADTRGFAGLAPLAVCAFGGLLEAGLLLAVSVLARFEGGRSGRWGLPDTTCDELPMTSWGRYVMPTGTGMGSRNVGFGTKAGEGMDVAAGVGASVGTEVNAGEGMDVVGVGVGVGVGADTGSRAAVDVSVGVQEGVGWVSAAAASVHVAASVAAGAGAGVGVGAGWEEEAGCCREGPWGAGGVGAAWLCGCGCWCRRCRRFRMSARGLQ